MGQPDQSRAARYVLKDYVNGKLLFVEPPPGIEDAKDFNAELYDMTQLPEKRRADFASAMEEQAAEGDDLASLMSDLIPLPLGPKSQRLDKEFFKASNSGAGHLSKPFNYKYSQQGKVETTGKTLSKRKMRTMIAIEKGIDPKDVEMASGKKHFKGGKKTGGKNRGNGNKPSDNLD
jgi:large subunit GTPase 1